MKRFEVSENTVLREENCVLWKVFDAFLGEFQRNFSKFRVGYALKMVLKRYKSAPKCCLYNFNFHKRFCFRNSGIDSSVYFLDYSSPSKGTRY